MATTTESQKKFQFDSSFWGNPKPCGKLLLYQIGELFCKNDTDIADHSQFCYEFTYIIEGEGYIYTNGVRTKVAKHDCYWSFIGDIHSISSDEKNPLRFCYVGYDFLDDFNMDSMHKLLNSQHQDPQSRIFNDNSVKQSFSELLSDITLNDELVPYSIECLLKALIIKAFRWLTKSKNTQYEFNKSEKSFLTYQIAKYIDENVYTLSSLNDLERVFNYNYQYLSRCFCSSMNKTIKQYFQCKKMETSAELLRTSHITVTEIAYKLNYSCTQAFTRAFVKYYRTKPLDYRKTHTT